MSTCVGGCFVEWLNSRLVGNFSMLAYRDADGIHQVANPYFSGGGYLFMTSLCPPEKVKICNTSAGA